MIRMYFVHAYKYRYTDKKFTIIITVMCGTTICFVATWCKLRNVGDLGQVTVDGVRYCDTLRHTPLLQQQNVSVCSRPQEFNV